MIAGLIVYGTINLSQLSNQAVEILARRFGSKDQKEFIAVLDSLRRSMAFIEHLEPYQLEALLKNTNLEVLYSMGMEISDKGEVIVSQPRQPSAVIVPPPQAQSCYGWLWHKCLGLFSHREVKSDAALPLLPPTTPYNVIASSSSV